MSSESANSELYFLEDAKKYAKWQGKDYEDTEFVVSFQKHLNNLPTSKQLRKKWLESFISETKALYESHRAKMKGECEPYCIYSLGYYRGIPHAKYELEKIDRMFLFAESAVRLLKRMPLILLSKLTFLLRYLLPH